MEWKHNNDNPEMIAERISALANSAALHGRDFDYLVWGVEDGTKKVVGTTFRPRQSKKGNEELENWLMWSQHPQVNFQMHEWSHQGLPMVLLQIPGASQAPVRFGSEEFIRIGSLTKKLKEYTEKERELWATFARKPFEIGIAKADVDGPDVLKLLDFDRCFKLLANPPSDRPARHLEQAGGRVADRAETGRAVRHHELGSDSVCHEPCQLRPVRAEGPADH